MAEKKGHGTEHKKTLARIASLIVITALIWVNVFAQEQSNYALGGGGLNYIRGQCLKGVRSGTGVNYTNGSFTIIQEVYINDSTLVIGNATLNLASKLVLRNSTMWANASFINARSNGGIVAENATLILSNITLLNGTNLIVSKNSTIIVANATVANASVCINATASQVYIFNATCTNATLLRSYMASSVVAENVTAQNVTGYLIYVLDGGIVANNISAQNTSRPSIASAVTLHLRAVTQGGEGVDGALFNITDSMGDESILYGDGDGRASTELIVREYMNGSWVCRGPFNVSVHRHGVGSNSTEINITSATDITLVLPTSDAVVTIVGLNDTYYASQNITFSVTLYNLGAYRYLGWVEVLKDGVVIQINSITLNTGAKADINLTVNFTNPGQHTITARTNTNRSWYEVRYDNDNASTTLSVMPLPKLILMPERTWLKSGEYVNISLLMVPEPMEHGWDVRVHTGDALPSYWLNYVEGGITITKTYPHPGIYSVWAEARNEDIGMHTSSDMAVNLTVENRPPQVEWLAWVYDNGTWTPLERNETLYVSTYQPLRMTFNSTDPDGAVVEEYILTQDGKIFGNETVQNYTASGTYTVIFKAIDDEGADSGLTVHIIASNPPPQILGVAVIGVGGGIYDINVTASDNGPSMTYYMSIGGELFTSDNGSFVLSQDHINNGGGDYTIWVSDSEGLISRPTNGTLPPPSNITPDVDIVPLEGAIVASNPKNATYQAGENGSVVLLFVLNHTVLVGGWAGIDWVVEGMGHYTNTTHALLTLRVSERTVINITLTLVHRELGEVAWSRTIILLPFPGGDGVGGENKTDGLAQSPPTGVKGGDVGGLLWITAAVILALAALVLYALHRRGILDVAWGGGIEIMADSYRKEDLAILRKGEGHMRKYELYSGLEQHKGGGEDVGGELGGREEERVYELRILVTSKGDIWSMGGHYCAREKEKLILRARDMMERDIKKGWEVYVPGREALAFRGEGEGSVG